MSAVRVELEIVRAVLRVLRPVDQSKLERHANFPQDHMRHEAGIARIVIESDHRLRLSLVRFLTLAR